MYPVVFDEDRHIARAHKFEGWESSLSGRIIFASASVSLLRSMVINKWQIGETISVYIDIFLFP